MATEKTTTWGDCPNTDCREYGRMVYGIEPDDECKRCYAPLRWWDRWHDGKHRGSRVADCIAERELIRTSAGYTHVIRPDPIEEVR